MTKFETSVNKGTRGSPESDRQRAAEIAETDRMAGVARRQQAANKSRVKAAAKRHIGPLK